MSAILTAALLILFGSEASGSWNGLVQRVFVAVPLLVAATGIRLVQTAADNRRRPRARAP